MCGIVGVVTGANNGFGWNEEKMFADMLYADAVRGIDSTGVFSVSHYGNVDIHKAALPAWSFLGTKEVKEFITKIGRTGKMAVGHNRSATRGSISDKNAHPFWVEDKIVLVQNGTYRGSHTHMKDTEVDTEAIAHHLCDATDIEKSLQEVNAAYALVWYNVPNKTLNIIRNSERPMWLADLEKGTFAFASEPGIIAFAATRHKILVNKLYELPEHTLVEIKMDDDAAHTLTLTKLDSAYKQQYQQEWLNHHWSHNQEYNRYIPAANSGTIETYIHGCLSNMKCLVTCPLTELDKWRLEGDARKSITVEVVDYFPVNDRTDCDRFWVLAQELNEVDTPRYFYWDEDKTSERYILDNLYQQILMGDIDYEHVGPTMPNNERPIVYKLKDVVLLQDTTPVPDVQTPNVMSMQ